MADPNDAMKERWEKTQAASAPAVHAGIIPHLVVNDGAAAIDFYARAFGASEQYRMLADDGKRILNAALIINGSSLMLNDDFPEMRSGAALTAPAGVTLHLGVDDADVWYDRAVKAGATSMMPLSDMFWGDRYGQVRDPFGYTWSIGAPVKKT